MSKARFALVLIALLAATTVLFGQFGFGKSSDKKDKNQPNLDEILAQGNDLVGYVTLATDQGMKAMDTMTSVFPPEKVAKYQEFSKKYNEAKGKRKDGNIDSEQYNTAGEASAEFAKLDTDWQSYQKDKVSVIPQANGRLGLMLLADAQAATRVPGVLSSLQGGLNAIGGNPMQMGKASKLKGFISVLTVVGQKIPSQVNSYKTVRGIAKKIADAEKMTLPPDPAPDAVKDRAAFQSSAKAL
jgi:hypothetical protein